MPGNSHDLLIFDLDGTLTDPAEGISRSIDFSLTSRGYPPRDVEDLARAIGPPIDETFASIVGSSDEETIAALVALYRERYGAVGPAENVVYDGIPAMLARLWDAAVPMAVYTSKRVDFAERILDAFDLRRYFRFVSGGDVGIQKWQQLAQLLGNGDIPSSSLMIGDRGVDLAAAHRVGIAGGGVLWGYGEKEELQAEDPGYLFDTPHAILEGILWGVGTA